MSADEQLLVRGGVMKLAEMANRCADFFKHLSQFCRGYTKVLNDKASVNDQKPEKKKKEKSSVDPNLPKKPLTAYLLYFQEKKPSFVEKYPDLTLSALTKLIAKDWNELPQQIKKPYLDKADQDRQRYDSQLGSYKEKHKSSVQKESKETKEGKEPRQPKEGKDAKEGRQGKQPKEAKEKKDKKKEKEKKEKPTQIEIDSEGNAEQNEDEAK